MIPFAKMHGLGNDFVLLREADLHDRTRVPPDEIARRVCERHFGIGADGLLVYGPVGTEPGSRVRMRYWNADGSRAEMCGNGARCVVRLAYERRETRSPLVLETDAGEHRATVSVESGHVTAIELEMGAPNWEPVTVPANHPEPLRLTPVRIGPRELLVSAVSIGNPHAVVFVPDREALELVPLEDVGRALSLHEVFPDGANASFVTEVGGELYVRVWERGSGPTLACGTAACAVFAVAVALGKLSPPGARVHLPGGAVQVRQQPDGVLYLSGPATWVAEGHLTDELLQVP